MSSIYGALFGKALEAGIKTVSRLVAGLIIMFFIIVGLAGAVVYLLVAR